MNARQVSSEITCIFSCMLIMFIISLMHAFSLSMIDSRRIAVLEEKIDKIAKNLDAIENSVLVLLQDEKERLIKQQESK